ncbi:ATP-dependent helicase [Methylopila turkensis]|uniref:ATP-dependent helicase n=1 Tax=Methylopila turkensis TaxID=1437816 RepID=UPI0022F31F26|nr:ATP-dependent helicase [Methylopila turkensis]
MDAPVTDMVSPSLAGFTPATRDWFTAAFTAPTPAQAAAWTAIGAGDCALVVAPTGSGKTLAAFLHSIDQLFQAHEQAVEPEGNGKKAKTLTRVLYISPIKALGSDVQRNLRIPLDGVAAERQRRGDLSVNITVGMRTGDTPSTERAALLRRPPDILITTPESLYLMLTSKARETLREVTTVIVDEVHAVAGTKRGAHLALSLERLDTLLRQPAQRIGLSATVRPADRIAAFLGGARPTTVINPPSSRQLELRIIVPVEDMTDIPARDSQGSDEAQPGRVGSIWPHVEASILDQILARQSTIVFANSRGLAEKLTARLNELYGERHLDAIEGKAGLPEHYVSSAGGTENRSEGAPALIARSHHGSVSKEQRGEIETALKTGALRCVVATSSLELGIDMGLVDLVIQVGAPLSVASGLQRVGRASHQVGGTSTGLVYPRTRRDLVDAAVTVDCMLTGRLEAIDPPRNPLDVLAQQTVAAVAMDTLQIEDWYATVRRSDPFRELPRRVFDATLDMLAGRYPSDEFAEFRPRLVWDRDSGLLSARPGAQQLAVISGGTIPDRGMFSVMLPQGEEAAGSRRVGELDEEMVYESRVNDVITLGATSWRIQEITNDQVVVVPAPGRSARLPFWRGDGIGRPAELGEAIGAFLREIEAGISPRDGQREAGGNTDAVDATGRLAAVGLDPNAISNVLGLLTEQREATEVLPSDRTLVIERCRDETGDWRVILHSPYGQRVHGPWALAIAERIRSRLRIDPSVVSSDDGIVARIPDTEGRVPGAELFTFDPDTLQRIVTEAVGGSALFAARFRECAARALLLPRRNPGKRSPLWQQRLRAGQLLEIARDHADFPILIETARECLQDVYDLPALHGLMQKIEKGTVRLVEVTTDAPSPFAANLLFGYVAEFMYDGDAPLAERRASVLALDSGLLGDLLGQVDLGELLDPGVVERVGQELQRTAADRRVKGVESVADLLRELGPMGTSEIAMRLGEDEQAATADYLEELVHAGRIISVTIAGQDQWAIVEDAARLRDALGVKLPGGLPKTFLQAVAEPLRDLFARYARTHTPFTTGEVALRFGLGVAVADTALERLRDQGKVLNGNFGLARRLEARSDEAVFDNPLANHEWVSEDVFRRLRLRSLQAAREATKPVSRIAFTRLMLERQLLVSETAGHAALNAKNSVSGRLEGVDGVARVIEQLAGLPLLASIWETQVLPARVHDYRPGMLDELIASGEVLWAGHGAIGDDDGQVSLHLRDLMSDTLPAEPSSDVEDLSVLQRAILDVLAGGGAFFVRQLSSLAHARMMSLSAANANLGLPGEVDPGELREALWDLAWKGHVTADTWAPLRALADVSGSQRNLTARPVRHRPGRSGIPSRTSGVTTVSPSAYRSSGYSLGDTTLSGRWSLLHHIPASDTERAFALVEGLLDRYGVVARGAAVAEAVPGGFPQLQPVLRAMEDAGRVLRGRFVEGLGGAQFADRLTIERLRELAEARSVEPVTVALSALDPANPFGTLLGWPAHPGSTRPTRRSGAIVIISDGKLALYLTSGRKQLLSYIDAEDPANAKSLASALLALAAALKRDKYKGFTLETVDDHPVGRSALLSGLRAVGFSRVPKGVSWYG